MDHAIVIPSRDRPADLRETLRRLQADTSASGVPVIVCDNGEDCRDTFAVTEAYGAIYVREPRPGLSRARNAALRATRAKVVIFLDDDISVPDGWAGAMTRPIDSDMAEASVCQIGLGTYDHVRNIPPEYLRMLMVDSIDPRAPFLACSFAVSRAALDWAGGFNVRLGVGSGDVGGGEDLFLTLQLKRVGYRIAFVPGARVIHRIHPEKFAPGALLRRREVEADTYAWLAYHMDARRVRLANPKWRAAQVGAALSARFERTRGYARLEGRFAASAAWHRRMTIETRRPSVSHPPAGSR